ncbi:MAG: hypothetical protein AAEF72_06145, partial [Gammaproteobacteria bacterium]
LYRKSSSAQRLGNNDEALKYANNLKEASPEGLFVSDFIKLLVYNTESEKDKFLKLYNELLAKPEGLLAINKNTYHLLLSFTIGVDELSKHAPMLYQKYNEYHGYSCVVENNIAIHYYNDSKYTKSAEHMQIIIDKGDLNCIHQALLKPLQDRDLIAKIL